MVFLHDSWFTCNMQGFGTFTGRYHACYMHGLLPTFHACLMHGMCMFHVWNLGRFMLVQVYSMLPYSTLVQADFMHDTGIFSRCVFMHGAGVFHAWYVHSPCMVQVYSRINTHEVKKLSWLLVLSMLMMSQSSYIGPTISLDLHTNLLETNPSLSVLSMESLSRSKRRQRWLENVTITSKQSIFNEIHTMHVKKIP